MAEKTRLEIAWVSFIAPARLSSQDSGAMAFARGATTRLYKGEVEGIPHVLVEDPSLTGPGNVPWTNVASVGWYKP